MTCFVSTKDIIKHSTIMRIDDVFCGLWFLSRSGRMTQKCVSKRSPWIAWLEGIVASGRQKRNAVTCATICQFSVNRWSIFMLLISKNPPDLIGGVFRKLLHSPNPFMLNCVPSWSNFRTLKLHLIADIDCIKLHGNDLVGSCGLWYFSLNAQIFKVFIQ